MKATETLIYTNTATNQSISISFLSNLIPTAFEEDVDASFYTDKNSGQDGETLQNLDLEPREITIKAVFQADSNYRLFDYQQQCKQYRCVEPKAELSHFPTAGKPNRYGDNYIHHIYYVTHLFRQIYLHCKVCSTCWWYL